jgi:hypothetical protein
MGHECKRGVSLGEEASKMEGGGKEGGVDMLEVYYAHMYESSIMKPTENCKKKTNKKLGAGGSHL